MPDCVVNFLLCHVAGSSVFTALFALLGFPMSEEDPRKVLEYAREHREELYEPMINLALQYKGVLVTPESAAKTDEPAT